MTPAEAAEWAAIAYLEPDIGRAEAQARGYGYILFSKGAHQCVVASRQDETVIAFRGTEFSLFNWRDVVTSLKARLIPNPAGAGRVHNGYSKGVWALIPLIKPLMRGQIYLTGHSMGGAMAILAGGWLKVDAVFSFNAPKSSDQKFALAYPVPLFRFESRHDWVPWFPSALADWVHVGGRILLDSQGHSLEAVRKVLCAPKTLCPEGRLAGEITTLLPRG
ncbi:lipase family protein [Sneathiella limimaris]|uniref:lipase family protein n=1 Tax=Sneathiella limimaris TaxID=1964213 RepID=UPI00146C0AEF|nr:lipase family protein [Sneathiella limimaris]